MSQEDLFKSPWVASFTCSSSKRAKKWWTSKTVSKMSSKDLISDIKLYHGESLEIMIKRWNKLEKDFLMKNDQFDISKVPDIYDCIKLVFLIYVFYFLSNMQIRYDLQHNHHLVSKHHDIYTISKALADVVIPQVCFFFFLLFQFFCKYFYIWIFLGT